MLFGCLIFIAIIFIVGITTLGLWEVSGGLELLADILIGGTVLFIGVKCINMLGIFLSGF